MNTAGIVALIALAYLAGLGTYWGYVILDWHIGKRQRSWSA